MGVARTDNPGMGAIWDKCLAQPKGQDLGSVNHSSEDDWTSPAGRQRWTWFPDPSCSLGRMAKWMPLPRGLLEATEQNPWGLEKGQREMTVTGRSRAEDQKCQLKSVSLCTLQSPHSFVSVSPAEEWDCPYAEMAYRTDMQLAAIKC